MERFFLALGQRLHRNRTIVLLLVAGVTLLLALAAGRSTVDNSIGVWQTENDPHWLHFQEFSQRHHLVDPLVVYLPEASPEGAREINSAARKIKEVERTTLFHLGLPGQGYLLLLFPKPQSSPPQLAELIREIKQLIAKQLPGQATHLGGVWYLTDTLDSLSASSTQRLFPLVIVILTLGVLLFLRNLRHTALALVCGLLPALHLTGLLALAHEPLNVILLSLPPLTMILGITHAIHLLKKNAHPKPFAIYAQVAPPCLLCALTTMLGFLSLLVSAYTPVQKLGLWGAVGSVLSLITTLLLLPLFPSAPAAIPATQPEKSKTLLGQVVIGHKNRILLVVAGLVVLSIWGILHLEKGSFILAFFKPEAAISRDYRTIEQAGIGLTPLEIDLDDCPAQSRAIQQAMLTLAQRHPEITHFFSFYDERGKIALPMATANGASLDTPLLPSLGLQAPIRLTILTRTLASEKTMRMVDAMEGELQDLLGAKPTPYVTGTVPLYTRGQREMFTTLVQTFGLAFLSVSLVMGLALRSLRLAVLAIIPNFVPVLYLLGTMGLFGIPLSVASVTVASIVFGVVVDDTIHFLHTWQEMAAVGDPLARLHGTISHTAYAMFTSSIVTATGFLGFLISPFMPLRDFGLLISLSLLYGIICDLLLLPALLLTFGTAKGKKTMTIAASLIEEIIATHFDPRAGSAYWLEREKLLGLEARKEITCCESFHLFGPMDTEALRTRPLLDFIPKQFHGELATMILAESGGTTGPPIRRVYLPEEFGAAFVDSWVRATALRGFPRGGSWLFVGPSGPHVIGQSARAMARSLGSLEPFSVDCDVRWIKRQGAGSLGFTLYLDHMLDQALNVIRTQNIEVLLITPPLLLALAARMSDEERNRIRGIHLAGMALTVADSETIRHRLFPQAVVLPGYGNSLVGVLFEHTPPGPGEPPTYVVDDPALWLQLLPWQPQAPEQNPDLAATTLKPGQRGRVVVHRLDPSFLLLNLVERDTACYAAPTDAGDCRAVTAVEPIRPLISSKSEGVY